jgi:hypothetical protein
MPMAEPESDFMTHSWFLPGSLNISVLKDQLTRFTHHQLTNHHKKEKSHLKHCRQDAFEEKKSFFFFLKGLERALILQ